MCIYIPSNEELSDDDGDSVGAVVNSLAAALVVLPIELSVSSPRDGAEGDGDGGTVDATEEGEGDGWIVAEEEEEGDGCWVGWGGVEGGAGSVRGGMLLLGRKRLILRLIFLMIDHGENSVMDILPYLLPIENSPAPLTG